MFVYPYLGKPTVETQTSLHSMQSANVQITSVKRIQFFWISEFVVVVYSITCRECWYLLLALSFRHIWRAKFITSLCF